MKTVFIKTYGCQMNVYDSQRMLDVLAPHGFQAVGSAAQADLIILNTCHIREKAAEKVYSELGRLKELKETPRAPLIAVAGCVAQAEGEEMIRRAPQVDLVFGPQSYHRLPELLAQTSGHRVAGKGVVDTDFPTESKFDFLPEERQEVGGAAFLSIQEGCDKFCTFCVVPYTRGAEFSRPVEAILAEAKGLLKQGVKEITLLGQNVNAYHGAAPLAHAGTPGADSWGLARLIYALAELEGLTRLRYTTSHPRDMDDDLIAAHARVPQLMPYLHLPVQSGSDRILAAMNRGHKAEDYLRIIDKLRAARPDLALSSDFIVGFPGESDQDFAQTLALVNAVVYAQAYSFIYSPRPGTPAAAVDEQVPQAVKADRLETLQGLLFAQQEAFNRASKGKRMEVLFERKGKHTGQMIGRSPFMQSVYATGPLRLLGEVVEVEIMEGYQNSVSGEIVTHPESLAGLKPSLLAKEHLRA